MQVSNQGAATAHETEDDCMPPCRLRKTSLVAPRPIVSDLLAILDFLLLSHEPTPTDDFVAQTMIGPLVHFIQSKIAHVEVNAIFA